MPSAHTTQHRGWGKGVGNANTVTQDPSSLWLITYSVLSKEIMVPIKLQLERWERRFWPKWGEPGCHCTRPLRNPWLEKSSSTQSAWPADRLSPRGR